MLDHGWIFDILNDEQKSLVALMKDFCVKEVDIKVLNDLTDMPMPPKATREDLMARVPWDIISKAHDAGLRQLTVPKEYGGTGYAGVGNWLTMAAMAETAGYYGGLIGRIFTIPWNFCNRMSLAPKPVQDALFTNFMKNRRTMTAGSLTEPDHGSDMILPYDEPSDSQNSRYPAGSADCHRRCFHNTYKE